MSSSKIVKDLKKKEFSTVLNDIQLLISCGEKKIDCFETCNVLRALYQAIVPSSTEVDSEDSKKVIDDMIPCINLCINHAQNNYLCSDLIKNGFFPILYFVIRTFLKVKLYTEALSYGKILKTLLENKNCSFDDKNTYIKNPSIVFWNDALNMENDLNSKDFDTALAFREISIEFLLLDNTCIEYIFEKIKLTTYQYCQNTINVLKLGEFMKNMWQHVLQKLEQLKLSNSYESKIFLFKLLQMWYDMILKFVKDHSIMQHFLLWFQDLSKSCKKKDKICIICSDLSRFCIQFFILQESEIKIKKTCLNYEQFHKSTKKWDEMDAKIIAYARGIISSSLGKCFKTTKIFEDQNFLTYMQSNIQIYVAFVCYFLIFSEEMVENYLPIPYSKKVCHVYYLTTLFAALLKREQDDMKKKFLSNEAENFLKFSYLKITNVQVTEEMSKVIIEFAQRISNLAFTLYKCGLYYESIYFFEVSDSIFSTCSSLPIYNSEKTNADLWKLHEISIYSCYQCGQYEKALQIIVKSLRIHEDKTKECFDLWRKVKRDALRSENKCVISITVSDILLEMNATIDIKREISYLLEEFKICRSERLNLDEEIIVIVQKLLNMPLSMFNRAFLLLEMLTMPADLCSKIFDPMKKSLSEVCLDAINLFVDHLTENPNDYTAKLYLSLAYFWIYQNNVKRIHEIAEKEAQNILKPPTPKAKINDVEEENDACDFQPVHSLVSLSVENECLKNLNLAVSLWEGIETAEWQDISHIVKEKNVLDIMIATAETYCTAVRELEELKLWLLLQSVSIAVESRLHKLTACISLVNLLTRLGWLEIASYFLKDNESNECFSNSDYEIMEGKFQLAKSYYFLRIEKFDDGLKILQDMMKSSVLKKGSKSAKLLHAEVLLLLSEYLCLPTKAYSEADNIEYLIISSPLAYLTESVGICKAILKYFSKKQSSFTNELDWLCFKQRITKNLLKSHLRLGEFYFKSGDPRFARCLLQDALKVAESQALVYWSSKILLVLGHIDLTCDNFKDCRVKVSGLNYVLDNSTKVSCLDILKQLQDKYFSSDPTSPDLGDEFIISAIPDITLPRYIKQEFIDKIDVMASPQSKRHPKNNVDKFVRFNFNEENFSVNILKLEIFFLSYLLSQTEPDTRQSDEILQELLDYLSKLKNMKHLCDTLKCLKLGSDIKEPLCRLLTKIEIILYTSIYIQKIESLCIKNDILKAKDTVNKAFSFLDKTSNYPRYSYPDLYSLLKYQDIKITLCEFYEIPLDYSLAYYICPSIKPNMTVKKKKCVEKSDFENSPSTPINKMLPKIVINSYKNTAEKCQAPLKKNLLNTNLKKDLESEISSSNSPFLVFSSSDEEENFESPFNSLSRSSKIKSGHKKVSKTINKKALVSSYKFFKQKNNNVVKDASDIWNLCLTDTPKLGKENRKLRSAVTVPKSSQVSKKKTRSVNSLQSTKLSKTTSKKSEASNSSTSEDLKFNKLDLAKKQTYFESTCNSERKTSIEYSRCSPLSKNCRSGSAVHPGFSDDVISSDSVFFSPAKKFQKRKIPSLIEDLCKDLSSLSLGMSNSPRTVAGNLDEILNELSELRLLLQNSMPYPLYADICKLLGVLLLVKRDGSWNDEKILQSIFLLCEAFSVSLRNTYIGSVMYCKEPEFSREKDIIIDALKRPYNDVDLQMESYLRVIPENWTVIQVTTFHNQAYLGSSDPIPCPTKLIITQCQKNSKPLIVSTNCASDERFCGNFLSEFAKILDDSSLTMLKNDSKTWWKTRSSLDVRLKDLVRDIENIWLGCWKGLFLGIPQNDERAGQVKSAVEAISKIAPCKNEKLLEILVDSAQFLSKDQVCAAVCHLWNCTHNDDIHSKLCRHIRHISFALPETERHPLILILDQSIQDLPWECMPIAKGVPITRMPSFSLLHTKLALMESESVINKGFDTSKTYYVLNPGGDLTHSQEYFQDRFQKQINWKGVAGKAPSAEDFVSGFKDHELFIYCGHGSGRKYFESTSVDRLRFQSTSVIMGCSSGKLRRLGRVLEAHGIVLRLLLSGCPSITANLWDVTDKDIDRFTDRLFQSLIPNYDDVDCIKYDVAKAVSLARSNCKMRYLVGAAPIVYGFPVFARNQ